MHSAPAETSSATRVHVGLRVRGVVQGVGFRPTVHRLATAPLIPDTTTTR